jgi:hypothetical protein
MTLRALGSLSGILLALAISGWAFTVAADQDHQAHGLALAPFGWTRVLVVHLLAMLPLSVLITLLIKKQAANWVSPSMAWVWAVIGVGLVWWTVQDGASIGDSYNRRQVGFEARLVLRFVWCLMLQVPWCLFGQSLTGRNLKEKVDAAQPGAGAVLLALVVAVALPGVYATAVIDTQAKKAEELLRGGRQARVQGLIEGLCDLGREKPLAGVMPHKLRVDLREALRGYTAAARQPLPESATTAARLERARLFAVLDRYDEAERLLKPLAEANPEATLLLAAILQDRQRWDESSQYYRKALEMLAASPPDDPAALAGRVKGYDGLAFNARGRKAPREAEAYYLEALELLPAACAHFHFQLGGHYQISGRPGQAIEHLQTAARLDPARYDEPARSLIEEMTLHTPSCLLRWRGP